MFDFEKNNGFGIIPILAETGRALFTVKFGKQALV